jgi:hypothetical protein
MQCRTGKGLIMTTHVHLYCDPDNCRLWHEMLIERLEQADVAVTGLSFSSPHPLPFVAKLRLGIDRRFFHGKEAAFMQPIAPDQLAGRVKSDAQPGDQIPDLVIDCVGDGNAPAAKKRLTILYNGVAGDEALIASIAHSGLPQIAHSGLPQIAFRDETGAIVATAAPSGELAGDLCSSMDQVYARLLTLMEAWISHPDRWVQELIDAPVSLPSPAQIIINSVRSLAISYLKWGYYRIFHPSHWRIGWRWVGKDDVWSRRSLEGEPWQVVRDPVDHFYADPVPCYHNGRHYLFFEDLDHKTDKGVLSVLEFDDSGPVGAPKPCLEEAYHLSYPFLIEEEGEVYMIPETRGNRDVALYKATNFPFGWQRHQVLIEDIDAADVTITKRDGKYWIFCVTLDGAGGYSDCLSIFHADSLFGPWQPHAQNPVLIDKATARPAGNFVEENGRLMRPVQDCSLHYGARLNLVEVTHLSDDRYEQRLLTKLGPNARWPGRKLHTLNRAGNLEVIDGAVLRPRFGWLRDRFDQSARPQQTLSALPDDGHGEPLSGHN